MAKKKLGRASRRIPGPERDSSPSAPSRPNEAGNGEQAPEFVEALLLLMADDALRAAMGRNGRSYVQQNYRWDVILGKYDRLISGLTGAATSGQPRLAKVGPAL